MAKITKKENNKKEMGSLKTIKKKLPEPRRGQVEEKRMSMKVNKTDLRFVVKEMVGEMAIPIIERLYGKRDVSEFVVANECNMEIHEARNILYKMNENNIITFFRKKDKIKGWYICYWTINQNIISYLKKRIKEQKLEKLKQRLKKEENGNQFYMCKHVCIRMEFDEAMEFNFKCPECGELMHPQDNKPTISFLKKRIREMEKEKKAMEI
ncbi:hypothetical protein JW949_04055 [Candidatus Woesearchaeota archaeon]|nr:hypothetical protein [Candidatus Woesearchaeota archaeon]